VELARFKSAVCNLPLGKRLPTAVYLHIDAFIEVGEELRTLVLALRKERDAEDKCNLLKLHLAHPKISFLSYPDFDEDPHPALKRSITIDLLTGRSRVTSYENSSNPPILHRKEAFLAPGDPRIEVFRMLTRAEEKAGLYEETKTIGFRQNWQRLLDSKGLRFEGHRLLKDSDSAFCSSAGSGIEREKTALKRYELSKPTKLLVEFNLLRKNESFFDYGCGLGSDVRGLRGLGFSASGWDPNHAPDESKVKAEVVNLGFVLNVIEDPAERIEVLSDAWAHAKRLLIVSTLILRGESYDGLGERFGDGVRTQRNTFQKYFEQGEFQNLIEHTLGVDSIPCGLGVFIAFRDESDAQDFLSSRYKRVIDWEALSLHLGLGRPEPKERRPRLSLYERYKELLDDFWSCLLDLGRQPKELEFERLADVRKACGSIPQATRLFEEKFGLETMEAAREQRREDILVFLASSQFRKRVPFKEYSAKLQNDIRVFFGGYGQAVKQAKELLFAAGDTGEIELACESVSCGWQTDQHISFHSDLLEKLPAILRIYVACGTTLYGNPKEADVIKIHKLSRKLTLLHYKDFRGDPFPELHIRIKIDLRRMFVSVFDHTLVADRQVLFFKERFVEPEHEGFEKMIGISKKLEKLGFKSDMLGDNDRFAPGKIAFLELLENKNLTWSLNKRRRC
jgi:DNA phosphorothioation-associated putative methyltransferase